MLATAHHQPTCSPLANSTVILEKPYTVLALVLVLIILLEESNTSNKHFRAEKNTALLYSYLNDILQPTTTTSTVSPTIVKVIFQRLQQRYR